MFQLCKPISELSELPKGEYALQYKMDGCRCLAVINNHKVNLWGRENDITKTYPMVVEQLKDLPNCVLDGEIVSGLGKDFNDFQNKKGKIHFLAFDILKADEIDLKNRALSERIKHLEFNVPTSMVLDYYYKDFDILIEKAKQDGYEGVILKDLNSAYTGDRKNWFKLKFFKTAELKVIKYKINNKGIRAEDINNLSVQIAGEKGLKVKESIDNKGYCFIICQYLEKTKEDKLRFPSFKMEKNEKKEL